MTSHGHSDLPSEPCDVGGAHDDGVKVTYDPNSPFLKYDHHPPAPGPERPKPPRRRGENRMRRLEQDTAHHSSESDQA